MLIDPDMPELPLALPATVSAKRKTSRRFAGLTPWQLLGGAALLCVSVWGMWVTREIMRVSERKIVAVRLAGLVSDYVAAQARSNTAPDQITAQTTAYMKTLESVLKAHSDAGQTVLVAEAVVSTSVPDITEEVRSEVAKHVRMPLPVAVPAPLLPSLAPSLPIGSAPGGLNGAGN